MSISVDSLTAVVLNWQTPDYTIRCVEALEQDGAPASRIVVVDNGSSDGSYDRFRSRLPHCVLVRLEENVGFGAASNAGASALPADAYLFLDNDAFVHESGSLRALLLALDDPSIGIVAPRVLNPDLSLQPTVAPIQTPAVALVRASGLSRLVPNRWQPRWSTHWDHATPREIRGVAGPALLVRGSVWAELGGFDERVYMYADDLDLCWRARSSGWRIWFAPDAVFTHVGGASTRPLWSSRERAEMVSRSEAAMIRRNLSPLSAAVSVALLSAGCAARWLAFSALRRRAAAEYARGSLRGYLASE
jgi:N-acetylglucosaminyl-diphospho-decaprenol L-rhamnosyltransferase